jgi:O-succinylbenzoate synthase
MKLESVELLRLRMPLVSPFRTSFGVQTGRDVLLVVA